MKQFDELGLAEPILRAVSGEGYTTPTPIQSEVIPAMLRGRDIVGIAQTGTGKTAAFVLPLLHEIYNKPAAPKAKSARALILAPTRELAQQIAESIRTYGRHMRRSYTVIVGGAKPGPQVRTMARGVDIIVATPGRLLDHLGTGAVRLDATTSIVLDEADQMLDLGFMPAIRRIMAMLPRDRQTVLLSATMPKQIRALAQDFLSNPAEIAVTPESRPVDRIAQKVIHVAASDKRAVLADLLKTADIDRTIVFTRTKRGADRVTQHLEKAGHAAAAIHGNKSQSQRQRTLASFKANKVNVLVATDIAARGIDIDDVSHVINYELPNVPEAYVHRIGRTARAGRSGVAVSLCAPDEQPLLRDIERLIKASLPAEGEAAPVEEPAGRKHKPHGARKRTKPAGRSRTRAPAKAGERNGRSKAQGGKPGAAAGSQRQKKRRDEGAADAGLSRMLGNIGRKPAQSKRRRPAAENAAATN